MESDNWKHRLPTHLSSTATANHSGLHAIVSAMQKTLCNMLRIFLVSVGLLACMVDYGYFLSSTMRESSSSDKNNEVERVVERQTPSVDDIVCSLYLNHVRENLLMVYRLPRYIHYGIHGMRSIAREYADCHGLPAD